MALSGTRDRVRLEIGDTDPDRPLFFDDELDLLIAERTDNVLLIAADACDILATRFARDYDFGWSRQQSFSRSQMTKQYAARAEALRARGSGLSTVGITRVDGYSDDLTAREGSGGVPADTGRVRQGYQSPDQPW